MEYKVSLDWTAKLLTTLVFVLFLGSFGAYLSSAIVSNKGMPNLIGGLAILLVVVVFIVCFLLRPLKYVLHPDKIIIKRPYKDVVINLATVKDVYPITKGTMGWVIKTFGNGGFFGYFGSFRSDRYGAITMYATRLSNYIMLDTTERGKVVLTPDDVEMAKEIRKLIR